MNFVALNYTRKSTKMGSSVINSRAKVRFFHHSANFLALFLYFCTEKSELWQQ